MSNENLLLCIFILSILLTLCSILLQNYLGAIFGIICLFGSEVYRFNYHEPEYIAVKRIDANKFIQCIESEQYIVSKSMSLRGADNITIMLDSNGKPIFCTNKIYTEKQTKLPINKDKDFIVK